MLFVSPLNNVEKITLQEMSKNHSLPWTRIRASAVLINAEGVPLQKIAYIYGIQRQTVSIWLKNWENKGLCGLFDKPGRGRPRKTSSKKDKEIIEIVKKSPRSLKNALVEIEKDLGIKLSKSTLKKICKRAKLSWKRVRKSLKSKRNENKFRKAFEEIKSLIIQSDKGEIDFYYFDESGFTLEPCVPYAWQEKGNQIEIPSQKSTRLNVLGFLNRACNFESYVFEGSINSEVVIACFDSFSKKISKTKKTIVLIDNASIHTSHLFKEKSKKWKKEGLIIYNIPTYSPELNKIEILWRKIKYEWMDFSAYDSFKSLKDSLNHILANIGEKYTINFT